MNADELIKTWPGIAKANAETVLSSPAWRLVVDYGEENGEIRKSTESLSDALVIDITLDGEPNQLMLMDSELFPDLHVLWSKRNDLPHSILLALVEKECGTLLQMLENALRMQVAVSGLAQAVTELKGKAFELRVNHQAVVFSLVVTSAVTMAWGRTTNLDLGHEAIRSMTRKAWAELTTLDLISSELSNLTSGAAVVMPDDMNPVWRVDGPSGDMVSVRSVESIDITFAQMADDEWPEVLDQEDMAVELMQGGRVIGNGHVGKLGLQRVVFLD